jgi:hypothetical protein
MSIFGKIASAIFGSAKAAESAVSNVVSTAETAAANLVGSEVSKPAPMTRQQVEELIQKIAESTGHKDYNWKQSIVDLLKLLNLDSGLAARKELAQELGYKGSLDGSAEMNVWLHKAVMTKLMESGGVVPDSLK